MLFPTSSLRHKGVVFVPQVAQDNAPTAPELAEPLAPLFPFVGGFFGTGVGSEVPGHPWLVDPRGHHRRRGEQPGEHC